MTLALKRLSIHRADLTSKKVAGPREKYFYRFALDGELITKWCHYFIVCCVEAVTVRVRSENLVSAVLCLGNHLPLPFFFLPLPFFLLPLRPPPPLPHAEPTSASALNRAHSLLCPANQCALWHALVPPSSSQ